jgi:FkbM family methyltransferase
VDVARLADNVRRSWHHRAGFADFAKALLLAYSGSVPEALRRREWTIAFKHGAPINEVRLLLRANRGADAFIYSEIFDREHYRLPLRRAPATILDLGANIGLAAVYLSRCFPHAALACVEPIEGNLRVLSRNLKLNNVQAIVVPAAVHSADGKVIMEIAADDYDHKIMAVEDAAPESGLAVAAISVPSIMRTLNWDRIGLIKMDIEGHEKVLLSQDCDWLWLVDAVCLEYHDHFAKIELARVADRFGFSAPQLLPGGLWLLAR